MYQNQTDTFTTNNIISLAQKRKEKKESSKTNRNDKFSKLKNISYV